MATKHIRIAVGEKSTTGFKIIVYPKYHSKDDVVVTRKQSVHWKVLNFTDKDIWVEIKRTDFTPGYPFPSRGADALPPAQEIKATKGDNIPFVNIKAKIRDRADGKTTYKYNVRVGTDNRPPILLDPELRIDDVTVTKKKATKKKTRAASKKRKKK